MLRTFFREFTTQSNTACEGRGQGRERLHKEEAKWSPEVIRESGSLREGRRWG